MPRTRVLGRSTSGALALHTKLHVRTLARGLHHTCLCLLVCSGGRGSKKTKCAHAVATARRCLTGCAAWCAGSRTSLRRSCAKEERSTTRRARASQNCFAAIASGCLSVEVRSCVFCGCCAGGDPAPQAHQVQLHRARKDSRCVLHLSLSLLSLSTRSLGTVAAAQCAHAHPRVRWQDPTASRSASYCRVPLI